MERRLPRAKAVAVIRSGNKVFLGFSNSEKKEKDFYTPLGGGIEPREKSSDTVIREFDEETGLKIKDPRFLGIIENIFEWEGRPDHEIVLVYEADFADKSAYKEESVVRYDDFNRKKIARWMPIESFLIKENVLYPNGLLDLLKKKWEL